jgi:hypothetical protein
MENQSESFEKKIERKIENRIAKMIGIGVMIFVASAVFILVGGIVVQALWNWLVPDIFGLPMLDFWQALGLLALTRILFGNMSMGGGKGGRGWGRHRKGGHHGPPHLSPEEREHMKQSASGE